MSTSLTPVTNAPAYPGARSTTSKLALARELAGAGLLPKAYQRNPQNLLWAIEYGEALSIHPTAVINGVHVIDGKPTASAQLIGGLVRRAGHILRVVFDADKMVARAQVIRRDDPEFTFESVWDLDRAKRAGLVGKRGPWQQYPENMLKARAITEVARDAAPEALMGIAYTPEELGAEVVLDSDGEIVAVVESVEPASTSAQHQRIGILRRELGISDDAYRGTLRKSYGVDSAKDLTEDEASEVIARLERAVASAPKSDEPSPEEEARANESLKRQVHAPSEFDPNDPFALGDSDPLSDPTGPPPGNDEVVRRAEGRPGRKSEISQAIEAAGRDAMEGE